MRKEFIGHFKRPDSDVNDIWETATFAFDANVLLNLYRYSEVTRNDFLNLFEKVKDRIWLPEQVGYEFLKNRPNVIAEQSKAYADAIKSVEALSSSFSEERAHPFISNKVKLRFDKAAEAVKTEMEDNKTAQEKLLTEDAMLDKIADLFEGKVGPAYSDEEMSVVFVDGEKRYDESIPPGYKDEKKFKSPQNDYEKRCNYGDWILWRQLMDFAENNKKPVVFVTNDTKEDWWLKQSGKTLGPRPELIAEFFSQTQQHVLIYKPERFLDLGNKNLHAGIDKKSIAEVSSERKAREKANFDRFLYQKWEDDKLIHKRRFRSPEADIDITPDKVPLFKNEKDLPFEIIDAELNATEADLEETKFQIEHLLRMFNEAREVGDKERISEISKRYVEAFSKRKALETRLRRLRQVQNSDLNS